MRSPIKRIKYLGILLLLQFSQLSLYGHTPFTSINKRELERLTLEKVQVNGNIYYFKNYFSKEASALINKLGQPDYQAGWLDYLDDIAHSQLSTIFPSSFYNKQIPIKAYIWQENGANLLCLCSYDDYRISHFPMTFSDYFQQDLGGKWLGSHSGDDEFRILLWKYIDSLDSIKSILSPFCDPVIVRYNPENKVDIYEYYMNNYRVKKLKMNRFKLWKPLRAVVGMKRMSVIWHCGKPTSSSYIKKNSLTKDNFSDYWLIYSRLPKCFQIDEYYYRGYCQKMYYWNNRLQFVSFSSDYLIIE